MAGEIISIIAQASTQSGWIDSPVMSRASESDAARMSDLLSVQQVQPQAPEPAVAAVPEVKAGGNSIGDKILNSLNETGRKYQDGMHRIEGMLGGDGGSLSLTDALRLQMQLFQSSIQIDLMSKFTAKTGQHIDTLTKLQ